MADTESFENTMRSMNEKLERLRRKNELVRLSTEITLLERQINDLQTPDSGANVLQTETPKRSGEKRKPRRMLPDVPPYQRTSTGHSTPPLLTPNISGIVKSDQMIPVQSDSQPITSTPKQDSKVAASPKISTKGNFGSKIKPATYDGTGHWADYKAHFDACAEINGWTEREKGLYLAVSLRGQAQGVFGNLATKSGSYKELSNALQERFAPPNQTELYRVQLKERRQRATETLTELGQDIWRLTNLAYQTAPADLRETLAKEQFIDALVSSDMRLRIKQARPTSLNMAVRHAVELEAFNKAERKHLEGEGYMRSATLEEPMKQKPCILKQI